MISLRLYMLQRLSALFLVPMVILHLAVMVYAARGGLTADELLQRTQSSVFWMLFYTGFVIAVSVHAAIGVRVVVCEHFRLTGGLVGVVTWSVFFGLLCMGATAVYAVTFTSG